ncbi:MAG: helix-turn-helix domain-containing protein [Planctomycetota bacterium]|jgi:transcriptional regulator with XRE-family HTH domain
MEDFAGLLVAARERARMTQAQAAVAAGLTPSYLSFIENRKKPPPSDEVCRRLAEVLGISARRLIEVAHLERAPETVRRRVRSLRHTLKRERRSRRRVLESLLSPFLFAGPPGIVESALDAVGINKRRQKRIREALAALGRRHQDRAAEVARIVEELPERDRQVLLEALPRLLDDSTRRQQRRARREGAAADPEPPLHYAPPESGALPPGPYLLECSEETARTAPAELRPGDWLLVDARAAPKAGDLVVLRGQEGALVRRLERDGRSFRLTGSGPDPERRAAPLDKAALAARLAEVGLGTVLEVRRPLRGRGQRDV